MTSNRINRHWAESDSMLYYPMLLFVIAVLALVLGFDWITFVCAGIAFVIAALNNFARRSAKAP